MDAVLIKLARPSGHLSRIANSDNGKRHDGFRYAEDSADTFHPLRLGVDAEPACAKSGAYGGQQHVLRGSISLWITFSRTVIMAAVTVMVRQSRHSP